MRWSEISGDPNAPEVLEHRQRELDAAWRPPVGDRIEFIVERCAERRVLDIGCVDHPIEISAKPSWLHHHIVSGSAYCVGADINPSGVRALVDQGLNVVEHDVCTGPGPLAALGPFDVVVAGDIIEHVRDPLALFETAAALLAVGGVLILSTPNPYAPHRFFAGLHRRQWENADHLFYAFPSGIAELGSRSGLELRECRTVRPPSWKGVLRISVTESARRRVRSLWSRGRGGPQRSPVGSLVLPPSFVIANRRRWSTGFSGETALYVLEKADPGG